MVKYLLKFLIYFHYLTDEDPNFPASELNTHGPTVHGWRSSIGSTITPHDIVLRFHKPAKICRIQLLAHQYLIRKSSMIFVHKKYLKPSFVVFFFLAEKVELWLHYSPKSIPSTPSSQCFDFLGFVALADNAATNYKSRELQSVSVNPRKGTHLKLRLSGPHANEFNTDKQIALIAVNVLGEELDTSISAAKDNEENVEQQPTAAADAAEPALASMCDDLLFSMYVEETIADIIREMEERKAKAVATERFEYARKLKLCMSALRIAGERLGRYALAKRQAVQQEDFTTAKLRKEQIEMYKSSVFKHLLIDDLLEKNGESMAANDMACEVYASKPILPVAPSLQDVAQALAEAHLAATMSPKSTQDDKSSTDGNSSTGIPSNLAHHNNHSSSLSDNISTLTAVTLRKSHDEIPMSPKLNMRRSPSRHSSPMSSHQGSLRRRNKSAPRNSYEEYEDRAIPTLRQ